MTGPDGFTATPDEMSTRGKGFVQTAEHLRVAHVALLGVLDQEGQCWGKDDVGASFAKQYVQNALKALDTFTQVDGGVQSVAGATESWAEGYRQVDQV